VVFEELRARLPMPVFPSYDFIDVLELQGQPEASLAGDPA
jgi:hypothetical protein